MNSSWELRVEGRLIDEDKRADPSKTKRKFSSFFKSLVIELDKDLYGPDNHLVEWHRTPTTQETDGFQVGECETIAKQRVPWSSPSIHDNLPPGEKTWRRGCSLHYFTVARLSTSPGEIFSFLDLKMISALPSVQARPEVGQAAWGAHPNKVRSFQVSEKLGHIFPQACYHICALAVHQDPQAAGST